MPQTLLDMNKLVLRPLFLTLKTFFYINCANNLGAIPTTTTTTSTTTTATTTTTTSTSATVGKILYP